MATEVKEIDQIIGAMRETMASELKEIAQLIAAIRKLKAGNTWQKGVERIAELAERIVDQECENAKLKQIGYEGLCDRHCELKDMTKQRDRLVEQLSELTKSRDDHRSSCTSLAEQVATLKQKIEDQQQKIGRASKSLRATYDSKGILEALRVLGE